MFYNLNTINDFTCDFNRGNASNDLFILNHFVTDATLGYGLYNEAYKRYSFDAM